MVSDRSDLFPRHGRKVTVWKSCGRSCFRQPLFRQVMYQPLNRNTINQLTQPTPEMSLNPGCPTSTPEEILANAQRAHSCTSENGPTRVKDCRNLLTHVTYSIGQGIACPSHIAQLKRAKRWLQSSAVLRAQLRSIAEVAGSSGGSWLIARLMKYDMHGEGTVSFESLVRVVNDALARYRKQVSCPAVIEDVNPAELRQLFDAFDPDNSGRMRIDSLSGFIFSNCSKIHQIPASARRERAVPDYWPAGSNVSRDKIAPAKRGRHDALGSCLRPRSAASCWAPGNSSAAHLLDDGTTARPKHDNALLQQLESSINRQYTMQLSRARAFLTQSTSSSLSPQAEAVPSTSETISIEQEQGLPMRMPPNAPQAPSKERIMWKPTKIAAAGKDHSQLLLPRPSSACC